MQQDQTSVETPVTTGDLEQQGSQERHRFLTLDAMRGVAALIVVVYHFRGLMGGFPFVHGYLAVDFFFMLSGFVLTFAFQSKLDVGLKTVTFMKQRVVRLYPLYFLGLTLGLLDTVLQETRNHVSAWSTAEDYLLGAMLIPVWNVFHAGITGLSTPLDPPEWSIICELISNLIYGVVFRRRGWAMLLSIVMVSGLPFALYAVHNGTLHVGWGSNRYLSPVLRVTFSFFMGIAVYRVWRSGRVAFSVPAYLPILLLMLSLSVPQWGHRIAVEELLLVGGIFPLLLLLGAQARPWRRMDGVFAGAGAISYPVYVLQVPLVGPFSHVWIRLRGHVPDLDAPWSGIAMLVSLGLLSWGLLALYDSPVRAMLGRWLREGPAR
jgi:peptidoglycan/LPS O-acetylase OafA/YrhL